MRTARRFSPAAARRTSGGPVTAARADSSPAARRSEAWASAASGRTRDRASWSATRHAEQEQEQADPAEQQPGFAHAVPQDRGGHEGADHGGAARQPFHRHQHLLPPGSLG